VIPVSDRLAGVIGSRNFRMVCRATITRGAEVLATDLPVDVGREESDVTLRVPERVTLQIPRVIDGVDWSADGLASPIMPWGQRVHVKIGIGVGADGYEWINRGEFLIHDVDVTGDTITVTAVGLLFLLEEARLVAPYKPTGNLSTAIRRLIEPALTVKIDSALTDRSASGTNVVEEDRLQGVLDLVAAWPAECHVTPAGYLQIEPQGTYAASLDADLYILRYHVPGNTLLKPNVHKVTTNATRDGVVNAVVGRGVNTAGAPISAAVYDRSGGPASYGGPFNPLPVPDFISHPAARTVQLAGAMARVRLAQLASPFRRAWQLDCVPNPRILLRDQLLYFPYRGDVDRSFTTVVDRLVMPYTAASGPMVLKLREIPDA
jgi:hypothetical protein